MNHDAIRNSTLLRALADVMGDLSELLRTELRLARAEMVEKLGMLVRAGVWMAVAAVLGLAVLMVVVEAIVFGIASFGIALHWSCLIVAAGLAVLAGVAFALGRSAVRQDLVPTRTIRQFNEGMRTAREQLT